MKIFRGNIFRRNHNVLAEADDFFSRQNDGTMIGKVYGVALTSDKKVAGLKVKEKFRGNIFRRNHNVLAEADDFFSRQNPPSASHGIHQLTLDDDFCHLEY